MLPGSLMSSYERYKHDTAVFTSWLVHTAQELGYDRALSGASASGRPAAKRKNNKGKNNKGKKGKGKKGKGKAPSPAAPSEALPEALPAALPAAADNTIDGRVEKTALSKKKYEYILAIKDFVPLAEFILAEKQRTNRAFPAYVARALNRVIRARRSFSSVLKTESLVGAADLRAEEADNDKHLYFVGVLEKVRKIFKPLTDKLDMTDVEDSLPDSSGSGNPFDGLLVYNPTEDFQKIPELAATKAKAQAKAAAAEDDDADMPAPDYMVESEDTMEDAVIAFFALMQDAMALRDRVQDLWEMYAGGALDLAAAAVATNTATSLVRQMEDDVGPLLRKHGGILRFVHVFFIGMIEKMGLKYLAREQPGDDMNLAAYGPGDYCFFNVYQMLDAFRRAYSPEYLQPYNGRFGYFDATLDRSRMTNRVKYQQDKAAMSELFGEASIPAFLVRGMPCEDELIVGIRQMVLMKTRDETPLWVAFAAQACLDAMRIQAAGSQSCERPAADMLAWNKIVSTSIDDVLEYHHKRSLRIDNWPSLNDRILRDLSKTAKFWDDDPIDALKARYGIRGPPHHAFLRRNPVLCGIWMHYMRANFHEAGTNFVRAWGSVLYLGQLYFAMRREQVLPDAADEWYEMELVRMLQGDKSFFVGHPPTDGEGDFKNYTLFLGYSAANYAAPSGRNPTSSGRALESKAGPRSLSTQGAVSIRAMRLMVSGKSQLETSGGLTPDDVEKILEVSEWSQIHEDSGKLVLEKAAPGSSKGDSKKGKNKEKNKGKAATATPSDFVYRLALAVQAEIPEVAFDYFHMHRLCWVILGVIDVAIGRRLATLFDAGYIENASQLPFLVGYIFMASSRKVKWPGVHRLELMREAAAALQKCLPPINGFMKKILSMSNTQVDLGTASDSE